MSRIVALIALVFLAVPFVHAENATDTATAALTDHQETEKAIVTGVVSQTVKTIPGTDTSQNYQTLTALVEQGSDTGKTVTVQNDYLMLREGDVFFLTHDINANENVDGYFVSEPDRLPALAIIGILFVLAVLLVGGWTGLRGLIALAVSAGLIVYALLPGILAGNSPLIVSICVAGGIVVFGSYVTHGLNRTTTAAVVGMVATIIITALMSAAAIAATKLSGFTDENAVYLNFATKGHIDFVGLLLGAMIIGILGILYDAAIGQAVAVEELWRAGPSLSQKTVFLRAMRIGREHIGALVNTLAIAYVGAMLPLLLLFQSYADEPLSITLNREIFATEIVRAVIGSIGIVLAVPVTTLVAVLLLRHMRSRGEA